MTTATAKTIQIYLPAGEPRGIRIADESVHWPRSDFLDLAAIRRVGFGVTPC